MNKSKINLFNICTIALALLSLSFLVSSCNNDDDTPMLPEDDIVTLAQSNSDLSTLVAALTKFPSLVTTLSSDGTYTVFAPTNAAFDGLLTALGKNSIDDLPESVLEDVLEYHVLTTTLTSTELTTGSQTTVGGEDIEVNTASGVVLNSSTNVTTADVSASNGVVHIVDAVLIPPTITPIIGTVVEAAFFNPDFSVLVSALSIADLVNTLIDPDGTFTVFAPTNSGFAAIGITPENINDFTPTQLTPILLYHVLGSEVASGSLTNGQVVTPLSEDDFYVSLPAAGGAFINGNSEITAFDLQYSNGVVHVINRTLQPPTDNVVDIAIAEGFNELAAALTRAQLVDDLSDAAGTFTVFAPTDQAFQNLYTFLGVANVDEIDLATLTDVLEYHVLGSRVFSSDLTDGLQADPILEGTTTFTINLGSTVTITDVNTSNTDATVSATDVLGTNGVIHIIDEVILPIQ